MSANPNPKTLIAAFDEACNTGQIAITYQTANILKQMAEIDYLVNQIIESFQEPYDDKTQTAILDRICETYYPFKEQLQAEFSSHIGAMVFSDYSFNGL